MTQDNFMSYHGISPNLVSYFTWHNVGGRVRDGEDIDWMSLHKWRNHPRIFLKISPPYQKKDSTCNVEMLLGHCTSRKAFDDKQISQMDMWTWSFFGPPEQWESNYTPSSSPRNSNTHDQPNVQAFGQWREVRNGPYELLHLASYSQCKLESSWEVEFGPTLCSSFFTMMKLDSS